MSRSVIPRCPSMLEGFNASRIFLLGFISAQLAVAVPPTFAQLSPGTTEYKPGTTPVLGPPNYSTTLPSYFTAGNQVDSVSSGLIGGGGGLTFTSTVYRDPGTGFLGFEYSLSASGGVSPLTGVVLDDGSHPWQGIGITSAGADASGHSTAGSGTPNWTDGDPIHLFRDTVANGAGVTIQFLAAGEGTSVNGGDLSAEIFFATTAPSYRGSAFSVFSGSTPEGSPGGLVPVPEPSAFALAALAGTMLAMRAGLRHAARSR